MDQLIFADEAAMAGVPVPFLTIYTVGPTIARHGSPAQRAELLLPLAQKFQIDLVHLGLIMVINLGIGLCAVVPEAPPGAILAARPA